MGYIQPMYVLPKQKYRLIQAYFHHFFGKSVKKLAEICIELNKDFGWVRCQNRQVIVKKKSTLALSQAKKDNILGENFEILS